MESKQPTAQDLGRRLVASAFLTGDFRLRSGERSNHYFDKFKFSADPALLREIAAGMAGLVPAGTQVLAGIELGGIPIVTALALATGLPAAFVRKARKDYGTERLVEGPEVAGRRICLVEDIVTTGGQIGKSAEGLRAEGAEVATVLCVVNRGPKVNAPLAAAGLELRSLFHVDDLAPWMKK
jgi:orotate phosphoribosyltransferase